MVITIWASCWYGELTPCLPFLLKESVLDAKIADSGYIEEIDKRITPRTEATKQQLDSKLRLAEMVNRYEAVVSQLERDLINHV